MGAESQLDAHGRELDGEALARRTMSPDRYRDGSLFVAAAMLLDERVSRRVLRLTGHDCNCDERRCPAHARVGEVVSRYLRLRQRAQGRVA